MQPKPPGPDPFDADWSVACEAVEYLGVGHAIWSYRREPDPHARRAAADAIDAIDAATAALYRIRARLVTEVRRADDESAVRADALLAAAKTRDGPRETEGRRRPTPRPPSAEVMPSHGTARRRHGGEPREAAP